MSWVITGSQKVNWDPSLITTALWLDAADNTTVFADAGTTIATNGSAVQQWNDKSGNARHVSQSISANRPLFVASTLNGKSGLSFDGSNDTFATASSFPVFNNFTTYAVVIGNSGQNNVERGIVAIDNNTFNGYLGGYWFEREGTFFQMYLATGSHGVSGALPSTGFTKLLGHVRIKNSSSTLYVDGSLSSTALTGTPVASDYAANILYIGRTVNTWNGSICEVLISPSALDSVTREKMEGYLAHKWGLTANLPSNHPYKVNPPAP